MKLILCLLCLGVTAFGQFGERPATKREVERAVEDAARDAERRRQAREMLDDQPNRRAEPNDGQYLAGEADPGFRQFAQQQLNAAGPKHPTIGVYFSGQFKGKTTGQAIEILRARYYRQSAGGGALEGLGDGTGFGSGPSERRAWDSQFGREPAGEPLPNSLPTTLRDPDAIRAESARRALEAYPDAANPASALTQKIREITENMRLTKDPLLNSTHAPFRIVKLAADALGIQPQAGR